MSSDNHRNGAPQVTSKQSHEPNLGRIKRLEMLTKRGQHSPSPQTVVSTEPDFSPSGLLELDKRDRQESKIGQEYDEPQDKCISDRFRFYTFEDHDDIQSTIMLNSLSKYRVGSSRDNDIVLSELDPHQAVIQIRQLASEQGPSIHLVDLGSSGGCLVNGKRIPSMEFIGLGNKDTIKFCPCDKEFLLIEDQA